MQRNSTEIFFGLVIHEGTHFEKPYFRFSHSYSTHLYLVISQSKEIDIRKIKRENNYWATCWNY